MMVHTRPKAQPSPTLLKGIVLTILAAGTPVWADDAPFLRTSTAIVEDDDERVFTISTSHVNSKAAHDTGVQVEYSFSPTFSAEIEFSAGRDKLGNVRVREQGLSIWKAWVDPARSGWGLAGKLAVEREKEGDDGWEKASWTSTLAYSLPLNERSVWLHANAAARYQPGADRRWTGLYAFAVQADVSRQFQLFGEAAGASAGEDRMLHAGVRTWIKREKLAFDVGVGRKFGDDQKGNFVKLGLTFYDIGF